MPERIEIIGWYKHYETTETRKLVKLRWVPVPNGMGLGYAKLMKRHGFRGLGVWLSILEVASRKRREDRDGVLDYTLEDLALEVRGDLGDLRKIVPTLEDIGWIRLEIARTAESPGTPADSPSEGKGRDLKEGKGKEPKPLPPVAASLAQHLLDSIYNHSPKFKATPARLDGWARSIDRAMRLDGRTEDELRAVIDFAHRDPAGEFWRANILSGSKLREKFDTLAAQSRVKRTTGMRNTMSFSDAADLVREFEEEDRRNAQG